MTRGVIIGAGIGGLVAALGLRARIDVVVLEQAARLGGAAITIDDAWALTDALTNEPEPIGALTRYSRSWVAHVARVHTHAGRNAPTFHLSWRTSRLHASTLRLLTGSPHRLVERMDWFCGFVAANTRSGLHE